MIRVASAIGILALVAILGLLGFQSLQPPPHAGCPVGVFHSGISRDPILLFGTVADRDGHALDHALVSLVVVNADGMEVSRQYIPVDSQGRYVVRSASLPVTSSVTGAIVAAEADSYLVSRSNVTIIPSSRSAAVVEFRPRRHDFELQAYNSTITVILLLPGVFGLLLAVLHLTGFSRGVRVSQLYAIGSASIWCVTTLWLLTLYGRQRARASLVPLFWDDLFVSIGVIIFAFLGAMVYVAYVMHNNDVRFADLSVRRQQRVLLTIGGRILVAPYVALAGYGILAATFAALNTGAAAAFFGFFTGLWIEPVLTALADIGKRFLSPEAQERTVEQLLTGTQEPDTISSARKNTVERAFLDAVTRAKRDLLQREGVIGVTAGEQVTDGLPSGRRAIVAYVYEKQERSSDDPHRVPATIDGFPVDVQTIPTPPADHTCHGVMLDISADKLYDDHQRTTKVAKSTAPTVVGQVVTLVDATESTFFLATAPEKRPFIARAAFEAVRDTVLDHHDFVAFVLDTEEGLDRGYYFTPVWNDAAGTNYYWEEGSKQRFDQRKVWKVKALRGVITCETPLVTKTWLHEIGHAWSAYVDVGERRQLLDSARQHWSPLFDYGNSCMANSFRAWIPQPGGRYKRGRPADWRYSPLDLYLMGLLPLSSVPSLTLLESTSGDDYTVSASPIAPNQLRERFGERPRIAGFLTLRMGLVAVARTQDRANKLATTVDAFRTELESAFATATTWPQSAEGTPLAKLQTTL